MAHRCMHMQYRQRQTQGYTSKNLICTAKIALISTNDKFSLCLTFQQRYTFPLPESSLSLWERGSRVFKLSGRVGNVAFLLICAKGHTFTCNSHEDVCPPDYMFSQFSRCAVDCITYNDHDLIGYCEGGSGGWDSDTAFVR
jgi:hypothetical protein